MPYLDTSLVVATLTREAHGGAVQQWLASQGPKRLVISDWTATEFSAALSMKVCMRHLAKPAWGEALAAFTSLVRDSFTVLPVASEDSRVTTLLADAREPGLRAGDALHLGIVANHGDP